MKITPLQLVIVVRADCHNPSLLHPELLKREGIVGATEEPRADFVCTSSFSVVNYDNIQMLVEPMNLQITDSGQPPRLGESRAFKLAKAYVELLPKVQYQAVGVNPVLAVEFEDPQEKLQKRFIKEKSWGTSLGEISSSMIRLVFPQSRGRYIVGIDSGKFTPKGTDDTVTGVLINANRHFDLAEDDKCAEIGTILDSIGTDLDALTSWVREVLS